MTIPGVHFVFYDVSDVFFIRKDTRPRVGKPPYTRSLWKTKAGAERGELKKAAAAANLENVEKRLRDEVLSDVHEMPKVA